MMISLILPPLYFKMFYSYTPQIWSSLRCSLIVGITGEKEPLFHQDIMTDLKSCQDGLSQLIFTFQFHNQFNLFNNNFESYYPKITFVYLNIKIKKDESFTYVGSFSYMMLRKSVKVNEKWRNNWIYRSFIRLKFIEYLLCTEQKVYRQ